MPVRILSMPWSAGMSAAVESAAFVPDFVVSPTGGTGAGTENDPWSFAYAIGGAGGALTAGKTVGMHGGSYGSSGAIHLVTVAGSQGSLITFRNFPGEVVTIQGNVVNGTFGSTTTGAWVRFWGFGLGLIVYESSPSTVTPQNGIATHGRGVEWINAVVHDFGSSGIAPQRGPDGQIYGCIVYHNGKANNLDHGFYYMQFNGNTRKLISDNVTFQNWEQNYQGAGGDSGGPVDLVGNIAFSAGEINSSINGSRDYFDSRTGDCDTTLRFNYGWMFADITFPEGIKFAEGATSGKLILEDNVFYGGVRLEHRPTLELRRNKWYALRRWWWEVPSVPVAAPVWDNTDYGKHSGSAGSNWGLICPGGFGGGDDIGFTDLATWKTTHNANTTPNTTPDQSATFFSNTNGVPASGKLIVKRANAYETGRGHIVVYNWDQSSTVDVTLSGIVGVGQPFAIRHFQSLFTTNSSHVPSTPLVSSSSYDGGSITLPMTVAAGLPTPLGPYTRTNSRNPRETGPDYGAFLVLRS